jgi:hypothetical protein
VWTNGVNFENGDPVERSPMPWYFSLEGGEQNVAPGESHSRQWQKVITDQADLISWAGRTWCLMGGTNNEIWTRVIDEQLAVSSVAESIRTVESQFLSSKAPEGAQYHFNLFREYFDTYSKFIESQKRSPSSAETGDLVQSSIDSGQHAWTEFSGFAVDRYWWALPKDCLD